MDAFYAAIEQLDDASLRGRPLLIGPPSARGVVLMASYEARPYGVGSAMPMAQAKRMCPDAVIIPPRVDRYQEVSATITRVFSDFSPDVEALSLDEAFLDMTGSEQLFGDPESIGRRLKAAVREVTGGLTASVGLSSTKFVAKVASVCQKPDGLTVVRPEEAKAWLAPLAVSWLWGAGPKTQARLHQLGLHTIGDVARADPRLLSVRLGRASFTKHRIRAYARRGCAREGGYQISPASISRYDRQASQKKELCGVRCRDKAQDHGVSDIEPSAPPQ
jgi:DNA polymerase-4